MVREQRRIGRFGENRRPARRAFRSLPGQRPRFATTHQPPTEPRNIFGHAWKINPVSPTACRCRCAPARRDAASRALPTLRRQGAPQYSHRAIPESCRHGDEHRGPRRRQPCRRGRRRPERRVGARRRLAARNPVPKPRAMRHPAAQIKDLDLSGSLWPASWLCRPGLRRPHRTLQRPGRPLPVVVHRPVSRRVVVVRLHHVSLDWPPASPGHQLRRSLERYGAEQIVALPDRCMASIPQGPSVDTRGCAALTIAIPRPAGVHRFGDVPRARALTSSTGPTSTRLYSGAFHNRSWSCRYFAGFQYMSA